MEQTKKVVYESGYKFRYTWEAAGERALVGEFLAGNLRSSRKGGKKNVNGLAFRILFMSSLYASSFVVLECEITRQ